MLFSNVINYITISSCIHKKSMITDYLMITEKFNKLQVIMITDYN